MENQPQSLRDILENLKAIDDDLSPEDFDPAAVVGDLKDKVDAIKWRIDSWNSQAKQIQECWIDQLAKKKISLERKAEKLESYVLEQMLLNGFEKLPGHMMEVTVRKNNPAVEISLDAGPETYLQYDNLVIQKTIYQWDKKKVKELLESGTELNFARITRGNRVAFTPKKG